MIEVTTFDMVIDLARRTGATQAEVKIIVDALSDLCFDYVEQRKSFLALGLFRVEFQEREERVRRNPHTGGTVVKKADHKIMLKPTLKVKRSMKVPS